jgi:Tfp pilus assembly protein PilO
VEWLSVIITIIITLFSAIIVPGVGWIFMKINQFDIKLQKKMEEPEVRQLIDDKYDHTQADLREIKEKIDKIFDRLLNTRD